MELKVYEVQKSLINQHMLPKREQVKKKIIDSETRSLFADILLKQINKNKHNKKEK